MLDDAYANAAHIPGGAEFPARWAAKAQAFRNAIGARGQQGIAYGAGARQVFDMFAPAQPAKGTLVFVHGGFWRAFDASFWSHLAQGALAQGYRVAMPSYDLCPDVSIAQITGQIAVAVQQIAADYSGDMVLTGHSAGGHLVARMLDETVLPARVQNRIRRVCPISPLADLEPLLQTDMNRDFKMTQADARQESPIHQPAPKSAQVHVWVGAAERPAFVDQARWLAQAWDTPLTLAPGRHHFDVIDALEDPQSTLITELVGNGS